MTTEPSAAALIWLPIIAIVIVLILLLPSCGVPCINRPALECQKMPTGEIK